METIFLTQNYFIYSTIRKNRLTVRNQESKKYEKKSLFLGNKKYFPKLRKSWNFFVEFLYEKSTSWTSYRSKWCRVFPKLIYSLISLGKEH